MNEPADCCYYTPVGCLHPCNDDLPEECPCMYFFSKKEEYGR